MKKAICILLTMVMILLLSISAFAAGDDVTVNGYIGTKGGPSVDPDGEPGNYDITYHTTVHWWVTQENPTTVVNGDSSGPDPSVVNKIQNNNTATQIEVSLDSFDLVAGDATDPTMQEYLTLNLTDHLAADGVGGIDLSTGYTGPATYTALLDGGTANAWKFGFGGIIDQGRPICLLSDVGRPFLLHVCLRTVTECSIISLSRGCFYGL